MAIPTQLLNELDDEHDYAIRHFPPFQSAHQGLAIIEEELDELKREVFTKKEQRNAAHMRKESLQVATTALRFILDICDSEPT